MLTPRAPDVITIGSADQNRRRAVKAAFAGLVIAVVAVVGAVITWQVLWSTVSVSISGTYTTSDAPDQRPARRRHGAPACGATLTAQPGPGRSGSGWVAAVSLSRR